MRSSHSLDRVDAAFDGTQLVADAGLLLPATLTLHLGLKQLVERHLDLGRMPGQANRGDKLLTLVLSALAGGDCIDDADALRAGGTERILGFRVKAPSTLGTFLRHRHGQDAATAPVRSRRAAHPLGPPDHAPPAGSLALGRRVHGRARAVPGHPAPRLT